MKVNKGFQVDVAENIRVKNKKGFVKIFLAVFNGASGAQRLFFADAVDFHAAPGVRAEMLFDAVCLIAGAHHDFGDTAPL